MNLSALPCRFALSCRNVCGEFAGIFLSAVTAVCAVGNGAGYGRILSFAAAGICAAAHKRCAYMPQPTRVSALKWRGIHMRLYAGIAAVEGAEEYVHPYVPR